MSTGWNDTPISDIRPEGKMNILCISRIKSGYSTNNPHSNKKITNKCLYHDTIFSSWDNYSQRWIDDSERFVESDDVIIWKEVLPMSDKQLLKIKDKIIERKG